MQMPSQAQKSGLRQSGNARADDIPSPRRRAAVPMHTERGYTPVLFLANDNLDHKAYASIDSMTTFVNG